MIKRPMKASDVEDLQQINYPVLATPKIDGIRCLRLPQGIVSSSLKPIRNRHIVEILERVLPVGADGEIVVGGTFQDVTSGVMSYEGEPDFHYHVFDLFSEDLKRGYLLRLNDLTLWFTKAVRECSLAESLYLKRVKVVPWAWIETAEQLETYEQQKLAEGFEGVMVRDPNGPYKEGRSTLKQGWLLKVKRFKDSEAEVLGFEEMMHNDNAAERNELGLTKRSSAKAGKRPAGTLGKFLVRDVHSDVEFKVGTGKGLTHKLRKEIWENREAYLGKIIKYKYQEVGVKVAPRLPVFLGFRHPDDM